MVNGDKTNIKFKKVTRADLVGKWQGHTADQTKKILEETLGGVLFIDEAYQLITSHDQNSDNFGAECLTTLNELCRNIHKIWLLFLQDTPRQWRVLFLEFNLVLKDGLSGGLTLGHYI